MVDINSQLIAMLCEEMPFTRMEASLLVYSAPKRYKVHFIEKRNGKGKRLIAQPTAEVKILQRWVVSKFIEKLPIHNAATAYRPSIGIRDHAERHVRNKYLLKVDFKDFFPSISAVDISAHLKAHLGLTEDLAWGLARILTRNDPQGRLHLSIGAPSSPAVSNAVMYEFDSKLAKFCEEKKVSYSRYADDLALSTEVPHVLDDVYKYVQTLLEEIAYPKLAINPDKTVFTSKKYQRQLTGLILTNDGKVSLGREKKRMIRAMANNYCEGKLESNLHGRLKGFLAFAHSIEPKFVLKIKAAMGEEAYMRLLNNSSTPSNVKK